MLELSKKKKNHRENVFDRTLENYPETPSEVPGAIVKELAATGSELLSDISDAVTKPR